jgi:thioesterase domain-containing protein
LPRRCEVASAQTEVERLVTIDPPMVRADAARVSAALLQRAQPLARCQERQLLEDCNRSAVASITLARDGAGALIAQGIAWQSESTDALRDCVQQALSGALLTGAREGSDGLVTIHFHEGL